MFIYKVQTVTPFATRSYNVEGHIYMSVSVVVAVTPSDTKKLFLILENEDAHSTRNLTLSKARPFVHLSK